VADLFDICLIEDESFSSPYPRDLMEKLLEYNPVTFLVATDALGKPKGYAVGSVSGRSAHLISIAVLQDSRRKGAATLLLQELFRRLLEVHVEEVWLEVNTKDMGAIALYLKLGFEKLMTVDHYYSDGAAALKMRLSLGVPGAAHWS
jgi:ribosomal-protein-alanine N-acetyltransferase